MTLTQEEAQGRLSDLPGWELAGDAIRKEFKFKDFIEAVSFVMKVAFLAETADHHPDIDIRYSRVILSLSTHSAGGLTEKDFDLARQINGVETPSPAPAVS
jgi:4a-hydroxytetrahydrobiopterin dehydratase